MALSVEPGVVPARQSRAAPGGLVWPTALTRRKPVVVWSAGSRTGFAAAGASDMKCPAAAGITEVPTSTRPAKAAETSRDAVVRPVALLDEIAV